MQTTRIVEVLFNGTRHAKTRELFQYDYGQTLVFPDLTTPPAYQVQFCTLGDTTTVEMIGGPDGVEIPDALLQTGKYLEAYIFIHDEDADGETRYTIIIPVKARPEMTDIAPTPVEQNQIDQLINALNDGVEAAAGSAEAASGYAEAAGDSASHALDFSEDSEAWAVGQRGGVDVPVDDPTYENNSKHWSDLAAQSAAQAGYMYFHIDDNGDLIYEHTDNVNVTFYLQDGDLYVEAI